MEYEVHTKEKVTVMHNCKKLFVELVHMMD